MSARLWLGAALALVVAPGAGRAADPDPADTLAAVIDQQLAADWAARGITPAAPADDAEFVRRVYLDVIGRAPKVAEVRAFLEDADPKKRAKLVERLLTLPSHAAHFAAVTRAAWLPQTVTNQQFAGFGFQLEGWLRTQFRDNTPADAVVRKLLTVPFRVNAVGNMNMRFAQADGTDPDAFALVGFYQANESRPENLGAAVSRLFVGVKLECAQCHDHPFAPYSREQFWEFAAFFADLNPLPNTRPSDTSPKGPQAEINRLTIPNTEKTAVAKFFDGTDPKWAVDRTPRRELADWLTRPDNPYFANNLANRMWAHFFGVGIVDPVDEPGDNNPPSHPQLLDALGKAFAAGKFDNRLLVRAITRTRAYQSTSRLTHPTQADSKRFARMNVKGLTPAQLFDSLVVATGHREPGVMKTNTFPGFVQPGNPRSLFLNRFATSEKTTEKNTTILQALMLMNGAFVDGQTGADRSEILGAVVDVPGWETSQRVEALFLTALARRPTPEELEKFSSYVDRGGATGDKKKALGDVFWVLLNGPEFLFNH
ncbi:MAG: hypothetical protein JWO38_438 [Gemmataceae bacterium]|nr:hypothetical protein [Gemmataceae bacterium]